MPHRFTGLPQEIRDAILELCLIVDGPINPYPAHYEDRNPFEKTSRKPDVALLKVNKQVSAEASRILYGGNLWKLNWRFEDCPEKIESPEPEDFVKELTAALLRNKIWTTHRAQIRHVALDLDIQDLNAKKLKQSTVQEYERMPRETDSIERGKKIHDNRSFMLTTICCWKLSIILRPLKSVYIDVRRLFCSNGCCRLGLIQSACFDHLRALAPYFSDGKMVPGRQDRGPLKRASMPKITVVGLRNQDELTAARGWWEEWHGRQLDYVTDMNGQQIGLTGFFKLTGES